MVNDDRTTYILKEPIQFGNETITELRFQNPRAKHLMHLPLMAPTGVDFMKLAGQLSGQPPSVMEELSGPDYYGVIAVVTGFLQRGLEIGDMPSP